MSRRRVLSLGPLVVGLSLGSALPAMAADPVQVVYPSGLAKLQMTNASETLVISSPTPDTVEYELTDPAAGTHTDAVLTGVRTLEVKAFGGDDRIIVGSGGFAPGLIVYTGTGDDTVGLHTIANTSIHGVRIYGQAGDDHVMADLAAGTPADLWVFLGQGDDQLDVRNAHFDPGDQGGILHVETADGDDRVQTENNEFGRTRIRTRGGNDAWTSTGDHFTAPLIYTSQDADDLVSIVGAMADSTTIVSLGSGRDRVSILGGSFSGDASFDGGAGTQDEFARPGAVFGAALTTTQFEVFP